MSTIEKKLVLFFVNLKFIDGQMLTVTYKFTAMPNAECRLRNYYSCHVMKI